MEANILALLQGAETQEESKSSSKKWKTYKVKHDTTSNRKDFPLASAKPASAKSPRQKQSKQKLSAH